MASAQGFLTHGLLPFVGRGAESARIIAFWRGTFDSTGLRIMVLRGEAGIGKSRLITETMPALLDGGAAVVHVRLVPESTTSVIAPIARALQDVDGTGAADNVEPSVTGVAVALRRLSRLRATLVLIEDIQLLEGESVLELTSVLTALADESLAVICALRPVANPSRAAIERFVVDEITLGGLPKEAIDEMWRLMTSAAPTAELSDALRTTTLGNPLALRSALRGALASGALSQNRAGHWQLAEDSAAFVRRLSATVGLVVDGLTLSLSTAQRAGTERMAMLGEVFSHEAASALIDDADRLIGELCDLGILTSAPPSATPFAQAVSARGLLAFTHSLLHRALLEATITDAAAIARVMVARAPLCSLVPIHLLHKHPEHVPNTLISELVIALTALADWIDTTPDWRTASMLLELAETIASRDDSDARSGLLVEIARTRLETSHRQPAEERKALVDALLAATTPVTDVRGGAARLSAVAVQVWLRSETPERAFAIVDEILAVYPELRTHLSFASFLFVIGSAVVFGDDSSGDAMRRFVLRVDRALAQPGVDPIVRSRLVHASIFSLFAHFRSRAERDETFARFDAFAHETISLRTQAEMVKASRLFNIGHLARSNADATRVSEHFGVVGWHLYERASSIITLLCNWAWSEDTSKLNLELLRHLEDVPQYEQRFWRRHIGLNLFTLAVLKGECVSAHAFAEQFSDALQRYSSRVLGALGVQAPVSHRAMMDRREELLDAALASGRAAALINALELEIVELYDLVDLHALVRHVDSNGESDQRVRDARLAAVERALDWIASCGAELWRLIPPFVEMLERHPASKRAEYWKAKEAELRAIHTGPNLVSSNGAIPATIIGTVSVTLPDGEIHKLQGGRMRRLFAVLVAAHLLREELEAEELGELVAGDEGNDPEGRARIVRKTVHRLRELVGFDAVRTIKGAPQLNLQVVRVDLIDANELIERSFEALRRNAPLAAQYAIMQSFQLTAGEVAFPALYDSFFEAAREEFEGRQRRCALKVAQHLIDEDASPEACTLLRAALDALPGDDEIAEQLHDCLRRSGRFLDAERVRLRMSSRERAAAM